MQDFNYPCVPDDMIDIMWPRIVPFIADAVEYGHDGISIEGLYRELKDGTSLVMLVAQDTDICGVVVLCVHEYDNGLRVLAVHALAGKNFDEYFPGCLEKMKIIAKSLRCTEIHGTGRRGWARKLNTYGFAEISITTRLKI